MEPVCRVCEPSPDLVPREVETDRTRGMGIDYEILQIWSNQYFGILGFISGQFPKSLILYLHCAKYVNNSRDGSGWCARGPLDSEVRSTRPSYPPLLSPAVAPKPTKGKRVQMSSIWSSLSTLI